MQSYKLLQRSKMDKNEIIVVDKDTPIIKSFNTDIKTSRKKLTNALKLMHGILKNSSALNNMTGFQVILIICVLLILL